MIIALWQIDPEFRVMQELQRHLEQTALVTRGISIQNIVTYGHPLYTLASQDTETSVDSYFPKIGVEWSSDDIKDDLGANYSKRTITDSVKNHILYYINRDSDGNYEQYSYPDFRKALDSNKYGACESFVTHVVSEVLISGWGGTGGQGRKLAQSLYMATIDVMPFIALALSRKYKVNLEYTDSKPSPNVESPTIGNGAWGFEIVVSIRQKKTTYRLLEGNGSTIEIDGEPGLVTTADVYFDGKGTLTGKETLGKSTGNINFHPLSTKI